MAVHGSEDAFRSIVERHVNLVYSTARRLVSNPHEAEEVTQTVFILLARKARSLSKELNRPDPEDWKSTILAAASTHTNQHEAASPGETDEKTFEPVLRSVLRGQPEVD